MAPVPDSDKITLAALKAALIIGPIDAEVMTKTRYKPFGARHGNFKMLAIARHRFTNYDELVAIAAFEKRKMWGRFRRHVNMCIEPYIMEWLHPSDRIKTNNKTREIYSYQFNAHIETVSADEQAR